MPELRWTLLIIGVVFIAVLAWWERRRPHQASRDSLNDTVDSHPGGKSEVGWGAEPERRGPPRVLREPTLTLPEIRVQGPASAPQELPVVEIAPEDSLAGLDVGGDPVPVMRTGRDRPHEPDELENSADLEDLEESDRVQRLEASSKADPLEESDEVDRLEESGEADPLEGSDEIDPLEGSDEIDPLEESDEISDETAEELEDPREREELRPHLERTGNVPPRGSVPRPSPKPVEPASEAANTPQSGAPSSGEAAVMRPEPIVDWPPEDARRLLTLRLVAPQHGRFAGRAVRQALTAEGFVLGKFGIFHKPDAQNRAVVSAASLNKPGTFDLESIDTQRFGGLNLFVVLPGPKTPLKAFDELVATARTLNERLEGALQDERGGPLTPMRAAALREALGAETAS